MTITYPREIPVLEVTEVDFDLAYYESMNQLNGGQTQSREMASPRWAMSVTTRPMTTVEIRRWKAWRASLRNGKTFLAHDPEVPYPAAYPDGFAGMTKAAGGAFVGDAVVTALTTTTISLSGLPAGFLIGEGDLIGLSEGDDRALHRILEATAADGSGIAAVTVAPFVLTNVFTTAAEAHFERPPCIMILIPDSWEAPRGLNPGPVSFRAIQKPV